MLSHDALCNAACETTVWGSDIYMHAGPSVHSGQHKALSVNVKPLLMLGTVRPGMNAQQSTWEDIRAVQRPGTRQRQALGGPAHLAISPPGLVIAPALQVVKADGAKLVRGAADVDYARRPGPPPHAPASHPDMPSTSGKATGWHGVSTRFFASLGRRWTGTPLNLLGNARENAGCKPSEARNRISWLRHTRGIAQGIASDALTANAALMQSRLRTCPDLLKLSRVNFRCEYAS